jgi:hypothetical protein
MLTPWLTLLHTQAEAERAGVLALQALRSEEGALLEAVAARRRELAELAAAVQVRIGAGGGGG